MNSPSPAHPDPRAAALARRRALRREMRIRRASIPPAERRRAARTLARHARAALGAMLRPGARIAIYAAIGGEIDPTPLARLALERGCELLLPRIVDARHARMSFSRLRGPQRARLNIYGITEPDSRERVGARWLDLVFVPLLAFDRCGNRLGMGAGYYDRALSFRRLRGAWRGPRIIGLGFALQEVEALPRGAHDVPLDAVLTERGLHRFPGR